MARTAHGTLTPNVVTTVTLDDFGVVEVLNRNGIGEIFFTVDGVTPVVGAADTEVLPAALSSLEVASLASGATTVRLISSSAATYSVRGV
jgi:hypothetical protein